MSYRRHQLAKEAFIAFAILIVMITLQCAFETP